MGNDQNQTQVTTVDIVQKETTQAIVEDCSDDVESNTGSAKSVSTTLMLDKGSKTEGQCHRENVSLPDGESSDNMSTTMRLPHHSTSSNQSLDQSYTNSHCVAVVVTNEHMPKTNENYPPKSITNLPAEPPKCGSSKVDSQTENTCASVSDPSSECDTTNCQINNDPCITANLSLGENETDINNDISCDEADILNTPKTIELGVLVGENELNEDIEPVDNHSPKVSSDTCHGDAEPLREDIPDSNIANLNSDTRNITEFDNTDNTNLDNNETNDIGDEELGDKLSCQDVESNSTDEKV